MIDVMVSELSKKQTEVWLVNLDRYGKESVVKSGYSFSLEETVSIFIEKYQQNKVKPQVKVITSGLGHAFCDLLKRDNIPFEAVKVTTIRIGASDVHKFYEEHRD